MPNRMQRAVQRSLRTIRVAAGVQVTLCRGRIRVDGVTAGVGRTRFEVTNGEGILLQSESRDYLIDAEDYARLDPQNPEPKRGDYIEEIDEGGVIRSHLVSCPVDGEDCFRWQDQFRTGLRVHTVRTNQLRTQ